MQVVNITVKQFADLWGNKPRAVQKQLSLGRSYTPIVRASKVAGRWNLTVLKSWWESKNINE